MSIVYDGRIVGRQRLARYMIRCPFVLEKMRYDAKSCTVIYHSKLHATLKRNYQLMPALKWLRLLLNHIPDKYEHLVRYYGYYSNRSRGARRLAERRDGPDVITIVDDSPVDTRRKASWVRLIQKVYAVDPLECAHCGDIMRIIALIDESRPDTAIEFPILRIDGSLRERVYWLLNNIGRENLPTSGFNCLRARTAAASGIKIVLRIPVGIVELEQQVLDRVGFDVLPLEHSESLLCVHKRRGPVDSTEVVPVIRRLGNVEFSDLAFD
jgi:hypothetical protein